MRLADIRALDRRLDAAAAPPHPASGLKPGTTSAEGVAVAGQDGFLFIADGANRWERQYLGELTVTPRWIEAWRGLFAERQVQAAARGVALWNFVAPEKQVVYPEARWPAPVPSGGGRPLKQLMAALGPKLPLVYPDSALLAAKAEAPAFLRHNSHWTASGCLAALGALVSAMDLQVDLQAVDFQISQTRQPQDLSVHFFSPAPDEETASLAPAGEIVADNQMLARTGRHAGWGYIIRNTAAPDPRRLMIFGDSYAFDAGLAAALSAVFARTICLWSKAVQWEIAERAGAQVVLWESAERFLATLPDA